MPVIVARHKAETWLRLASGKAATGTIFVRGRGFCFPQRDWDDLIFACLTSWAENAVVMHGSGIELENAFFDGDFSFRSRRLDRLPLASARIRISFLRSGRAVRGAPAQTMSLRSYALDLGRAAQSLLRAAAARRVTSSVEVRSLDSVLARLRQAADLSRAELRATTSRAAMQKPA
jgi:hypothetical protein